MSHSAPVRPAAGGAIGAIAALLEHRTGQQIAASRAWRLETSLKPLLRGLGFASLDDLVAALAMSTDGRLAEQVVDLLLNQETSFFRDTLVLEMVADAIAARRAATPGRRLRIWSSGCSTGQEPLSLAMLLEERGLGPNAVDLVATDVSGAAITRARAGRFSQFEIQRGLSVLRMMRWFESDDFDWVARSELLRRVQFRRQNLVSDPAPPGQFDLVLCRNVLLYFPSDVRRAVFERLAGALRDDGLLVLGAGETVIGQTGRFAPTPAWRGLYTRTPAAR
ncbi:chemotaxis protein methyltransferase CheR [Sphingomonas guangdongensis]|uniref:Chemotaxis protein methyltransferase CheR n=1 Tax=Sphingomonas guangdongensis TaxID=1141890 RepID=A0A285R0I6_9SPHN|nr:protein-glutamate O-methyltransferase CheR [Sphingomonas guangdongensis]SOB87636.1 chemotaxis protein methyltransferase CheR [Sphingomonas guangdongensis]